MSGAASELGLKLLILENEQIKTKTILVHDSGVNILIFEQTCNEQ